MTKIYISGPISDPQTGEPSEVNIHAFRIAEQMLRKAGYNRIVNPVKVWACRYSWLYRMIERVFGKETAYMLVLFYDLWLLLRCTNVYKIPGWKQSRGANIESCLAYWFKIWPVPQKTMNKIDKKLAKYMEKYAAGKEEAA